MTKGNKKKETKKGVMLVLAFAFALIFVSGFASAWVCGDGVVQSPNTNGINEQCDDGNTVSGDGCSSTCQTEVCHIELTKSVNNSNPKPGEIVKYTLHYKNTGNAVCTGGGVRIEDVLDDGLVYQGSFTKNTINDLDDDGIDAAWYEVPGFDSSTNTLTWNVHRVSPGEEGTITFNVKVPSPSHCGNFQISNYFRSWSNQEDWKSSNTVNLNVNNACPICGDHLINQANETCDDGNLNNNDGCSSTCKIEKCGDSIKQTNEQCDDGNLNNTDGCRNNCQLPRCGDGEINQANETCDDGNTNNNDGCSSTCKIERCGDAVKQANEQCDDGNLNNNDGCRNNCKFPACGDGIQDINEECDDNNTISGDGCSSDCKTECLPYCGDGLINKLGEECDKGLLNGNVCTPLYESSCTYCSALCKNITLTDGHCGDGVLQNPPEECDDNNNNNGDGCSSDCKTEFAQCKYNVSIRYSYANSYGTGIAINNSETYQWVSETPAHLDQGIHKIRYYVDNNIANKTNNASITVKLDNTLLTSYYEVISTSHYKTLSLDTSNLVCGSTHYITVDVKSEFNGICANDSTLDNFANRTIYIDCEEQNFCGDGSLDSGEECDLGSNNGKMCTPLYGSSCTYCNGRCEEIVLSDGYCGDGLIQNPQEQCDDGNLDNGDGCSSTCQNEEQKQCIENISIRYSYANSFGTGIALGYENGTWISSVSPDLFKGIYKARYYVDNNVANTTNNAHIIVKLDNTVLSDYSYLISKYHSKTVTIDTTGLQCNSMHKISVKAESQCNSICIQDNTSDNYAERSFFVMCEAPRCGDGNTDNGEECDDGNTWDGDGCSANCNIEDCGDGIKQTWEQCDKGGLNGQPCTPLYGGSCTYCSSQCTNVTLTDGYCGDSVVQSQYEQCDKGGLNGQVCTPLYGSSCTYCNSTCKNVTLTDGYCGDHICNGPETCSTCSKDCGNCNPICGNGIKEGNEQCDLGNSLNGNVCTPLYNSSCTYCSCSCQNITLTDGYCGDSVIQSQYEQCDKGSLNGNVCTPLYGGSCTYCNSSCKNVTLTDGSCGDSVVQSQYEQCDLGLLNGQPCTPLYGSSCTYCNSSCKNVTLTDGYCGDHICNGPETCSTCSTDCGACAPVCGNGIKEGNEQCDLGTLLNGNVCTPLYGGSCTYCSSQCTNVTLTDGSCGDSIVQSQYEQCDKGTLNGQVCTPLYGGSCTYCSNQCTNVTLTDGSCGDSVIQSQYEQCDKGSLNGNVCTPLYGGSCTYCSSLCANVTIPGGFCGNGIIEATEACDDGNTNNTDGCRNNCVLPVCNDGIKDANEQCDLGTLNNHPCTPLYGGSCTYCSSQCTNVTLTDGYCGDSVIQSQYEQCDLGTLNGQPCTPLYGGSCTYCNSSCKNTTLTDGSCGDSVIQSQYEQCDKGGLNGQPCTPLYGGSCTYCSNQCTNVTLTDGYCGDSVVQSQYEQCDKGSLNGNVCTPLYGGSCTYCNSSCKNVTLTDGYCGDGILQAQYEQCDDHNNNNGDGCSSTCRIEFCGDGLVNLPNETCDDGNYVNNDGCSSTCKIERCGDSIKQANEECDDGNTNNLDACRNNCKFPYCGDGIKDKNEYCDDGNSVNGDGCSKTCRFECPNGICTPNITIEKFPPIVWECDNRVVYDDATQPGRVSPDGTPLVERINNYAFEGEQIQWKVLAMDKNGIEKIRDVYVTVDGNIEANCKRITENQIDPSCNARIDEEQITTFNPQTMAYYLCTLTVETPDSMHGQSDVTVEAIDLDGEIGTMDETESWFLNPIVSLGVEGGVIFSSIRPGTSEYSIPIILTNDAEEGSGVLMDMFISGTDFYDSSHSGAKCGTSNQLKLENFNYYATNGDYSTAQDLERGRTCDVEGYCKINYGIGFNDPNRFYDKNEIIQAQQVGPYYAGNLLSPGADMSLIVRLDVPEACNGNFDSGHIYFWGEAI